MQSLILRRRKDQPASREYSLSIRVHDMAETNYYRLASMPLERAALLVRTNQVSALFDEPALMAASEGLEKRELRTRWDRENEDPYRCFVLELVGQDETLEIDRFDYDTAEGLRLCDVAYAEDELSWIDDYTGFLRRLKVEALRAEADMLERGGREPATA